MTAMEIMDRYKEILENVTSNTWHTKYGESEETSVTNHV